MLSHRDGDREQTCNATSMRIISGRTRLYYISVRASVAPEEVTMVIRYPWSDGMKPVCGRENPACQRNIHVPRRSPGPHPRATPAHHGRHEYSPIPTYPFDKLSKPRLNN